MFVVDRVSKKLQYMPLHIIVRRINEKLTVCLLIVDYFFVAGHLWKWYGLYNSTPPSTSWIWKRCPEGSAWKKEKCVYLSHATAATDDFGEQNGDEWSLQ